MTAPASAISAQHLGPIRAAPGRRDHDGEQPTAFAATVDAVESVSDVHPPDPADSGAVDAGAPMGVLPGASVSLVSGGAPTAPDGSGAPPDDAVPEAREVAPIRDALASILAAQGLERRLMDGARTPAPVSDGSRKIADGETGLRPREADRGAHSLAAARPFDVGAAAAMAEAPTTVPVAVAILRRETHLAPMAAPVVRTALPQAVPDEPEAPRAPAPVGKRREQTATDATTVLAAIDASVGDVEPSLASPASRDGAVAAPIPTSFRSADAAAVRWEYATRSGDTKPSFDREAATRTPSRGSEPPRDLQGALRTERDQARAVERAAAPPVLATSEVADQIFRVVVGGSAQGAPHTDGGRGPLVAAPFGTTAVDQGRHDRGAPVRVLKLALSPAELGPVTIVIKGNASALTIKIEPQEADAARIVDAARDELTQRLGGAGYQIADLSVAQAAPNDDARPDGGTGDHGASRQPAAEDRREAFRQSTHDGGSRERERLRERTVDDGAGGGRANVGRIGSSSLRRV